MLPCCVHALSLSLSLSLSLTHTHTHTHTHTVCLEDTHYVFKKVQQTIFLRDICYNKVQKTSILFR